MLVKDPRKVDPVIRKSKWFILYENVIYKQVYEHPFLRCVTPEVGMILEEIHGT